MPIQFQYPKISREPLSYKEIVKPILDVYKDKRVIFVDSNRFEMAIFNFKEMTQTWYSIGVWGKRTVELWSTERNIEKVSEYVREHIDRNGIDYTIIYNPIANFIMQIDDAGEQLRSSDLRVISDNLGPLMMIMNMDTKFECPFTEEPDEIQQIDMLLGVIGSRHGAKYDITLNERYNFIKLTMILNDNTSTISMSLPRLRQYTAAYFKTQISLKSKELVENGKATEGLNEYSKAFEYWYCIMYEFIFTEIIKELDMLAEYQGDIYVKFNPKNIGTVNFNIIKKDNL